MNTHTHTDIYILSYSLHLKTLIYKVTAEQSTFGSNGIEAMLTVLSTANQAGTQYIICLKLYLNQVLHS